MDIEYKKNNIENKILFEKNEIKKINLQIQTQDKKKKRKRLRQVKKKNKN